MSRRKALGQNFLCDRSVARRIVDAVETRVGDLVVEIGPGRGALTDSLVEAAGRIAAVEIDPRLAADLRARFDPERLVLIETDYLHVPLDRIRETLAPGSTAPLRVVGNLPYSASKPIAAKIIRERREISRAVLMFQREVAQRITAAPGSRRYGPISVLAGLAFDARTLFDVGPRAFRPAPKVESRVIRWLAREECRLPEAIEAPLRACLAAGFGRRRRTLRNNLLAALRDAGLADDLLAAAGVDGALRAEQVPPDAFLRLAQSWPAPS